MKITTYILTLGILAWGACALAAPPVPQMDVDAVQRILHFQAALRAAEKELNKLDDAARARRVAEIERSIAETSGVETIANPGPVMRAAPLKKRDRAAEFKAEEARVAEQQALYRAAASELASSWPANPTAEDYRRLEELKAKYLPE